MGALGEDPSEFDQVREPLMEYWAPQDSLTEALVNRLARLMWRLERLEARQERYGTRHVKARQVGEAACAKAVDPQLESILDHLDALQEALQARLVTSQPDPRRVAPVRRHRYNPGKTNLPESKPGGRRALRSRSGPG